MIGLRSFLGRERTELTSLVACALFLFAMLTTGCMLIYVIFFQFVYPWN